MFIQDDLHSNIIIILLRFHSRRKEGTKQPWIAKCLSRSFVRVGQDFGVHRSDKRRPKYIQQPTSHSIIKVDLNPIIIMIIEVVIDGGGDVNIINNNKQSRSGPLPGICIGYRKLCNQRFTPWLFLIPPIRKVHEKLLAISNQMESE